jgi:hypothetical protein
MNPEVPLSSPKIRLISLSWARWIHLRRPRPSINVSNPIRPTNIKTATNKSVIDIATSTVTATKDPTFATTAPKY